MVSPAYRELSKGVALLRKHLLPRRFDPTGNYTDRVFTGVVSFRVLCHAAMEEYLESRATDIAIKASVAAAAGSISHVAACLMAFSDSHYGPPPDTLLAPSPSHVKAWPQKIDVQERAKTISAHFIGYLKMENHGIRERNFLRIVLPIGFRANAIDGVLLTELDSFGQLRGQFAHTSATRHIKSRPDPKDELDRVQKIVQLMLSVDQEMDRLLKSVSSP